MKPIVRNILIGGAILLVAGSLYAKKRVERLVEIFNQMTIKPNSLPKNIRFSNPNKLGIPQTMNFDIDILLKNPAYEDFAVTGYVATLVQVNAFFKNKYVGSADVFIDEISVPANDILILHDIPMSVNYLNALQNINDLKNLTINDFSFTGVIEVLGVKYEIGN